MAENPVIFLSVHIQVILQHHPVLGQGSCLIGAENVNGTQILDGIEVFNYDLLPAHGRRSLCQGRSHDHGKHFRSQSHRHGNSKQQSLHPVSFGYSVNEKYSRHHHQHKTDQHPGNIVYAFLKCGLRRFFIQALCHHPDHGIISHGDNQCLCAAADHVAAHKGQVLRLRQGLLLEYRAAAFLHRLALSGKGRLTDKQISGLQDS